MNYLLKQPQLLIKLMSLTKNISLFHNVSPCKLNFVRKSKSASSSVISLTSWHSHLYWSNLYPVYVQTCLVNVTKVTCTLRSPHLRSLCACVWGQSLTGNINFRACTWQLLAWPWGSTTCLRVWTVMAIDEEKLKKVLEHRRFVDLTLCAWDVGLWKQSVPLNSWDMGNDFTQLSLRLSKCQAIVHYHQSVLSQNPPPAK